MRHAVAALSVLVGATAPALADRIDDLARQVRGDPDDKVRLSAALALGDKGDARAVAALADALRDSSKGVRGVAAAGVGRLVGASTDASLRDRVTAELQRLAQADPESFVRQQAQKSLDALRAAARAAPSSAGAIPRRVVYVEVGPMADSTKARGNDGLLIVMRNSVEKTLAGKIPALLTRWPAGASPSSGELQRAGAAGAFYLDGSLTAVGVAKRGAAAEVSCDIAMLIASYPEKSMFGMLSSGGAVESSDSPAAIDAAKRDCVAAVVESMVGEQVVPTIRQRLAP